MEELRAVFAAGDEQQMKRRCLGELQDPTLGAPSPLQAAVAGGHYAQLIPLVEDLRSYIPDFDPGVAGLLRETARQAGGSPGRAPEREDFLRYCVCAWTAEAKSEAASARAGLAPAEAAWLAEALAVYLED